MKFLYEYLLFDENNNKIQDIYQNLFDNQLTI